MTAVSRQTVAWAVGLLLGGLAIAQESSAPTPRPSPQEIMRTARTVHIKGTSLFPAEPLEKKLFEEKEFQEGQLVIVKDTDADLLIELDRKELTWDFTHRMTHPGSGVILGSGKVIAWDGVRAAPDTAKQIMKRIRALRNPPQPAKPGKEK